MEREIERKHNYYKYAFALSLSLFLRKIVGEEKKGGVHNPVLSLLLCFHSRVLIPAFLYNIPFFLFRVTLPFHPPRARAAVIRLPLNARETE